MRNTSAVHWAPTIALLFSCANEPTHNSTYETIPKASAAIEAQALLRYEHGVRHIFEDSAGNFWFGSWQEGVCRFDGEQLTYFTVADGLDRNQVRTVAEDRNGTIWFDTGDGICSYDGKRIITNTNRDYNAKDNWQLASGDLWFGEDDGRIKSDEEGQPGVYRYDGEQLTFLAFPLPEECDNDWEYKCTGHARGKDGKIWFSTYGSVIGYDGESFSIMNNQSLGYNGSTDNLHVRSILEDSKGRLWIGNNGVGVLLHEDGSTINFTQENGLGSQDNRSGGPLPGDVAAGSPSLDRVFAIAEDSAGNIWFGTTKHGAWRYDGESLRNFTEKDGLFSGKVTAIYTDCHGDLWLGGNGVCKFNGESFDRMH
ncbi:MAG: ligand-binding sensor domain-containing protein [Planctomycetota bacterium]|jgi:ligand-binding sensor domain-containing protein